MGWLEETAQEVHVDVGESRQANRLLKPGLNPLTRFRLKGLLIYPRVISIWNSGTHEGFVFRAIFLIS